MARTRSIKPGFFDNDILGNLPPIIRLLFIGLWCIADREGRLEDRPGRIKKTLLGYDDVDMSEVNEMLTALHNTGFIYRYNVRGEEYIQIVNFSKHQNPHIKEKPSEIPPYIAETPDTTMRDTTMTQAPYKHHTSTIQAPYENRTSPAGTWYPITGTLVPGTGNPVPGTNNILSEVESEETQKKPNKNIISSKVFADDSLEMYLTQKFRSSILANNPKARLPDNLQNWCSYFDKLLRIDKRSLDDIETVMAFSQNNTFWMANILSPGKLRDKFDQLYLQMKRNNGEQDNSRNPPAGFASLRSWRTNKESEAIVNDS